MPVPVPVLSLFKPSTDSSAAQTLTLPVSHQTRPRMQPRFICGEGQTGELNQWFSIICWFGNHKCPQATSQDLPSQAWDFLYSLHLLNFKYQMHKIEFGSTTLKKKKKGSEVHLENEPGWFGFYGWKKDRNYKIFFSIIKMTWSHLSSEWLRKSHRKQQSQNQMQDQTSEKNDHSNYFL